MPYCAPTVYRSLPTADSEILATRHDPKIPDQYGESRDLAAVVAHGFSGSMERLALREVTNGLRKYVGVQVMDLRGHGRSTGLCTFGDREALDVDAAVGAARTLGYLRVVTIGWSMGAGAVLRHAGLAKTGTLCHGHRLRHPPDAVISVSAASRWFVRDTAPMRRIHWFAESATGRMVARVGLRVRIDPGAFVPVPLSPLELIGAIAPTPLLIVHGGRDRYFTLEHPRALGAASGGHAQVWIEPEFGHAEAGLSPGLLDRIGSHLVELAAPASTPVRADGPAAGPATGSVPESSKGWTS
ncbi:alpha/beta hydrolase [Frankia sp. AgPm24]|uniref:alpha/beta hydrolase n=1 Tax=Frankia sp. AgPm24 TaxID=631128 RepID=UPI00200DA745|nr:alpha/beta hydrolase [Frankia sp. AgPm24]MCK9924607.1 alpha/beta hydrolase [Frankia sp. AgPm24]